ncbi:hypothetical protein [Novipirellula sp.]|uniref:hypothetical protein n=1 Tax=Novipirellula sp. TaxID=2795430 RepID=UPI00356A05D6
MKRLLSLMILFAGFTMIAVPGCGSGGTNTSVTEDADAQAIADYEAAIKAEEDAMKGNAPGK